ncbi:hypothetical protein [Actinokineospora cianjurensis]|uniref:hypothetical protein n=1 Tax=Actinokineospora cianjurensis TaxID=585224 RepID=UPI0014777D81|nr:hypothetical protein [Actinokineospora cianjurensis]
MSAAGLETVPARSVGLDDTLAVDPALPDMLIGRGLVEELVTAPEWVDPMSTESG